VWKEEEDCLLNRTTFLGVNCIARTVGREVVGGIARVVSLWKVGGWVEHDLGLTETGLKG